MPTSGQRLFKHTRDSIIESALRKIGVIIQGEKPTTVQYQEALVALNSMVMSWQNRGVFLWSVSNATFNTSNGVSTYTLSYALEILNPIIVVSSVRVPLTVLTKEEYDELGDINKKGVPKATLISYTLDNVILTLYPVPNATYAVHYAQVQKLQDFVNSADNPDFPVFWSDALVYGLAYKLSAEYGIPLQERQMLLNESTILFNEAFGYSREKGSIQFGVYR